LLGVDGKITSPNAFGDDAIRSLLASAVASGKHTSGNGTKLQVKFGTLALKVGDPVPECSLQDLNVSTVTDAELSGRNKLLLFWSPTCSFCTAMTDDVKELEQDPPTGAPELLFVSTGDLERVQISSEGFQSRFLHDAQFDLGNRLGTNATPSAVLVDGEGRIASSLATGAPNVLLLAGASTSLKSGAAS